MATTLRTGSMRTVVLVLENLQVGPLELEKPKSRPEVGEGSIILATKFAKGPQTKAGSSEPTINFSGASC